jgi:hypothetical protein
VNPRDACGDFPCAGRTWEVNDSVGIGHDAFVTLKDITSGEVHAWHRSIELQPAPATDGRSPLSAVSTDKEEHNMNATQELNAAVCSRVATVVRQQSAAHCRPRRCHVGRLSGQGVVCE